MIDMVKYLNKIQILNLSSVTMFSPAFFYLLFLFLLCLAFFSPPQSFCVFYNLLTVLRTRCFTPIGLIHLSLLLSSPFLFPFLLSFLSLFSFFPPFSSFFSISLQIFGAATAAMPHRFRRACFKLS